MARKSQDLKRLEAKDQELAARMEALAAELQAVQAQREDINTARRVLEELSGIPPAEPLFPPDDGNGDNDPPVAGVLASPDATIGDMALALLREDPAGLTSGEILESIQSRWMPGLARTSLSPPLSRLKQRGVIKLVGDRWMLAAENEANS
jgi:hypothetical protein